MEGRLSEGLEHSTDDALSLDLFSMVEWMEPLIAEDFREMLRVVTRVLFLEPRREGSHRPQNRLVTPTVGARAQ